MTSRSRWRRELAEWWALIRDVYLTTDRRTLGVSRLLLGFFLIFDLIRRTPDWLDMYSNVGVLPSHVNLWRPQAGNFSLFNAFTTPTELWVLWALGLSAYVALFVGWHTKIAQIASLVFVTSMNGRILLIENGGYVVQNLLLLWTCFLPMGDRFSVDAMLASMRRRRERSAVELEDRAAIDERWRLEPVVTVAFLAVLLQLSAIYYFNVVHKTGPAWKNGTAVHYVLYNDRMATPFVGYVRDHLPLALVKFMTKTTLVFEAALPVCLLSPLARPWARRAVVAMMGTLHFAFGSVFTLGPFAWSCLMLGTLMFGAEDWDVAARTMRRAHRGREVVIAEGSAGALWAARVLARMDRFRLLRFSSEPRADGPSFVVLSPDGTRLTGARAVADVVAALPLGPLVAWLPRLWGLRIAIDGLVSLLERRHGSAWLGLGRPGLADRSPLVAPLSVVRRRVRIGLRESLGVLMLAAAVNQAAVELWCFKRFRVPQPEPLRTLALELRFLQGWFMFSPNPVMDDGIVVCDAETADGRHVDPFTGKPPRLSLDGSVQFNQIWQDYMNRIQLPQNAPYRDALKAWLLRYHERTGRPEDRIVAARVMWIHDINPRVGQTQSTDFETRELLAFDTRPTASR